MKTNAFLALASSEQKGWYYQARARAVKELIERFVNDGRKLEILDVGCGTGGTSQELTQLGSVTGLEPSATALGLLRDRFPKLRVVRGAVEDIPSIFPAARFDLATVMGVLYHRDVNDPRAALESIRYALRPGGWIIWNEAAYPFLWRGHDDFVHSGRRFYPGQMRRALVEAGFKVRFGSHLLAWAFPIGLALAVGYRVKARVSKWLGLGPAPGLGDDRQLFPAVNAALRGLTFWEWRFSADVIPLPLGISYLVVAQNVANSRVGAEQQRHWAA